VARLGILFFAFFISHATAALCITNRIAAAEVPARSPGAIRVATFNVALAAQHSGELLQRLRGGKDAQAKVVAEIIQQVAPDIILLNEFDFDENGQAAAVFVEQYLGTEQDLCAEHAAKPALHYPHRFSAPVNTGVASGFDLNHDGNSASQSGSSEYAGDAWGYGRFPGQYGMLVLSKFSMKQNQVRTFQNFRWRDMPDALLPESPDGKSWYGDTIMAKFPLSSKSHWDISVEVRGLTLHLLASHPTPPVFDGTEDRNGRRNHDEIRFWADYITADKSAYIVDDLGTRGGLSAESPFVIVGDLNSDPVDGTDAQYPIQQLLTHPRVAASFTPRSAGSAEQAKRQAGSNLRQRGPADADTADFEDENGPGNLRLDYVLPSTNLKVLASGVYWPDSSDPCFKLTGKGFPLVSSDHRLVWVDVEVDSHASNPLSE
jgi:endonuclease/exonuclease/phosphatase family metal-dependent hydrolase